MVAMLFLAFQLTPSVHAQTCQFQLGFATLRNLVLQTVGDCVTNEFHNVVTGDALQVTTTGLLVWRKADNWTAFTDGHRTWINGPLGLQARFNDERFDWEAPAGRAVQVFFSHDPASLQDFTAVFPVSRVVVPEGGAIASAALRELVEGPTSAERSLGLFTELGDMLSGPSNCGADFEINIAAGTATVRFCRQVTSAGIGQDARVRSQIQETLGQFETIDRVRLLNRQGSCLFDPSGMNLC
jgi:hypothetical protein